MNSTPKLRQLLGSTDQPLIIAGGGTPLEALAAQRAGFDAFYLSGYAIAAWRHGLPDIGMLGANDITDALVAVARVCEVPVIVDADTGYGDVASVYANVRMLENCGAAAVQIEDQVWPKKCGHMIDKKVIDADDAVRKIATAVDARRSDDTLIIARTDALAPLGLEEAIARARRFHDVGADVVFVDAPRSVEELSLIGSSVPGTLMANMSEGGRTPALSGQEFHDLGFQLVVFPTTLLRVAAKGLSEFLVDLRRDGSSVTWRDRMYGLDELNDLVNLDQYLSIEARANTKASESTPVR